MNKIIQLSQIFGVTTDYLLKDDITDEVFSGEDIDECYPKVNLGDVTTYMDGKANFAAIIGRGVLLCIYSIIPLLMLSIFMEQEIWLTEVKVASIGVPVLLLMVALAVTLFIRASRFYKEFKMYEEGAFELEYGVNSIMKERAEDNLNRFYKMLPLAVGAIIVSVIPLILAGVLQSSDQVLLMMVVVMLIIVGFAIYFLILMSITKEGYEKILHDGPYSLTFKKENEKVEKFASIYWPLIVAVYLGWSFVTMDWGLTWVVWPVAALIFAGLSGFFKK